MFRWSFFKQTIRFDILSKAAEIPIIYFLLYVNKLKLKSSLQLYAAECNQMSKWQNCNRHRKGGGGAGTYGGGSTRVSSGKMHDTHLPTLKD